MPLSEVITDSLGLCFASEWPADVQALLVHPEGGAGALSLDETLALIESESAYEYPNGLLPLAVVDDRSLAVIALGEGDHGLLPGHVGRWHLDEVPAEHQLRLLDVDAYAYVCSLADELSARTAGLKRILDEIGPAYQHDYLAREKRPRDFVVRPVRIACQNVVVGLAAIAQESSFDGLSVVAWQTCEVPHVATHEANRALAALVLCDAFQNGGTMEIRFDRSARVALDGRTISYDGHPERQVPASLRRYGRTLGIALGAEDPAAITPVEARELFLAVTPMRSDLRVRVGEAIDVMGIAPERLCFSLLSGVWREIELDWMLGTSHRTSSILAGGADWHCRLARQAEAEICRTAVMSGMYFSRLDGTDSAGELSESGPRVVEDQRVGVDWQVRPEVAAITFFGQATGPLPWAAHGQHIGSDPLTVLPRMQITAEDLEVATSLAGEGTVALLIPRDAPAPDTDLVVLRCPSRLPDLDKAVEAKLLTSRISRG